MFAGGLALLGSTADAFVAAPAQAPVGSSPKPMQRSDVSQTLGGTTRQGPACRGLQRGVGQRLSWSCFGLLCRTQYLSLPEVLCR